MPSAWRADFKRNDQRIMRYFFTFAKNELGWAGLGPMNTPDGKSNLSRKRVETFALGQGYFIHWPLTPRTPIGDVEQWTGGGRSMVSDQPPAQVGRASYYAALQTRFPAVFMQHGLTAAGYLAAHNLATGALPTAPALPVNSAPSFNAPVPAPTVAAPAISAPALPVVANQDDLPAALPKPQNGEQEQQQQQQQQAAALPAFDPSTVDWDNLDWQSMSIPDYNRWGLALYEYRLQQRALAAEPEAPQQPASSVSEDMAPVDSPLLDGQELTFAEEPALPLSAPDAAFQGTGPLFDGMPEPQPLELPSSVADSQGNDFNFDGVPEPQPLELPSSVLGPDYWDQADQFPLLGLPDLSLGAETGEILDWPAEQYNPPLF